MVRKSDAVHHLISSAWWSKSLFTGHRKRRDKIWKEIIFLHAWTRLNRINLVLLALWSISYTWERWFCHCTCCTTESRWSSCCLQDGKIRFCYFENGKANNFSFRSIGRNSNKIIVIIFHHIQLIVILYRTHVRRPCSIDWMRKSVSIIKWNIRTSSNCSIVFVMRNMFI